MFDENVQPASEAAHPLWIGITAKHGSDDWVSRNTHNYVNMVRHYASEPIILAPDAPVQLPDGTVYLPDASGRLDPGLLDALDGLILSGGGDVNPRYFGQALDGAEPQSIDEKRDELEIHLSQAALAKDVPIFAICRGCQVLNVAAGGGLVQHFDGHRTPEGGPTHFHDVIIEPESKLHTIVDEDTLPVNTYHHQGVRCAPALAPIFHAAAVAQPDNWIIEAYESRQHQWVLGVQWHPERNFELEHGHVRIWDSFVAACRSRQNQA